MLDALILPDKGTIKAFGSELKEGLLNDAGFTQEFRRKVNGKEHFVVLAHKKRETIIITTGWAQ